MDYFRRNIWLTCLMVLALVTAGVSPACAFVSGKMTTIEICGPDGVMNMSVPADQAPDKADQNQQTYKCAFCLMQAMGKALTTPATAIIDFQYVYDETPEVAVSSFTVSVLDGRLPVRGPPAIL